MERRDLIQDQIDQLGSFLATVLSKITGLKKQGNSAEWIQIINQDLKLELGFDDIFSSEVDDFMNLLEKKPNFNGNNLNMLANNLFLIAQELEGKTSLNIYQKCLKILELIDKRELTYSQERDNKMKSIEKIIEKYNLFSSS
jgi:hypothetical protein